jgi:hypothetical protein
MFVLQNKIHLYCYWWDTSVRRLYVHNVPAHLPRSMEPAWNSRSASFASTSAWHQRRRRIRMSHRFYDTNYNGYTQCPRRGPNALCLSRACLVTPRNTITLRHSLSQKLYSLGELPLEKHTLHRRQRPLQSQWYEFYKLSCRRKRTECEEGRARLQVGELAFSISCAAGIRRPTWCSGEHCLRNDAQ